MLSAPVDCPESELYQIYDAGDLVRGAVALGAQQLALKLPTWRERRFLATTRATVRSVGRRPVATLQVPLRATHPAPPGP